MSAVCARRLTGAILGSGRQEDSADSAGVAAAALEAKDREIHDLQRNVKKLNKKHADLVLQAQAAAKAAEKAAAQQAAVANNEAGREMRHQMDDADRELQYMRDELRSARVREAAYAQPGVRTRVCWPEHPARRGGFQWVSVRASSCTVQSALVALVLALSGALWPDKQGEGHGAGGGAGGE